MASHKCEKHLKRNTSAVGSFPDNAWRCGLCAATLSDRALLSPQALAGLIRKLTGRGMPQSHGPATAIVYRQALAERDRRRGGSKRVRLDPHAPGSNR